MEKPIPSRYLDSLSIGRRIENVKKDYEEGNIIEAFVVLYAQLEFLSNAAWYGFSQPFRKSNEIKMPELEFKTLTEILYHVELINQSEKSRFDSFRKGRNNVVHYIISTIKKPEKKILDQQFKDGLFCYTRVMGILTKSINKLKEDRWTKAKEKTKLKKRIKK